MVCAVFLLGQIIFASEVVISMGDKVLYRYERIDNVTILLCVQWYLIELVLNLTFCLFNLSAIGLGQIIKTTVQTSDITV